ncbi:MAG: Holliday junction resolvase RuvX [Zoogloeaceae bacterium]|jgi:putative Holliday junction resolvase|nr:Holliday junction resolvase RuvX [Zoogloeaceae bacterium]
MGTLLAFDFGEKRTGVATGETALGQALPLTVITTNSASERVRQIEKLIHEWRPEALIVGIPTHADGTEHDMTARARAFAQTLAERFNLPVHEADERLTSRDAEARLHEAGLSAKSMKPVADAVAAQLILQTWLTHHAHELSSSLA